MTHDRVEFVDVEPPGGGHEGDELEVGGPDDGRGGRSTGRWGIGIVGLVVVALLAVLLVARVAGGDTPAATATATATPSPNGRSSAPVTQPVFGLVGLPRAIGTPRELVAARTGDVVWMLDGGAGVVRIEGGTVTAVQLLESQATAIAVNPSGTRVYVATAASRPSIVELDATTLTLGPSRPLDRTIQALAVSMDAVWAASGARLLRLDLDSLATLATIAMPGVITTSDLRVDNESVSDDQVVTGLVAANQPDDSVGVRFVRVDPLTEAVAFGPVRAGTVAVATSPLLDWVTWQPPGAAAPTTEGFATVLDTAPQAVATPALPTGSRIYDGGGGYAAFLVVTPNSSVVSCRDPGGFATSEVDVAPAVPDAIVTGPVLRTDTAFYVGTDRGLIRSGVGACR